MNKKILILGHGYVGGYLYDRLKQDLTDKEQTIKMKIEDLNNHETNYNKYLKFGINLVSNLNDYYTVASVQVQQKIVSSIFPQKLIFEEKHYRTNGINQFFEVLMRFSKDKKNILNENPPELFLLQIH